MNPNINFQNLQDVERMLWLRKTEFNQAIIELESALATRPVYIDIIKFTILLSNRILDKPAIGIKSFALINDLLGHIFSLVTIKGSEIAEDLFLLLEKYKMGTARLTNASNNFSQLLEEKVDNNEFEKSENLLKFILKEMQDEDSMKDLLDRVYKSRGLLVEDYLINLPKLVNQDIGFLKAK